MRYVAVEKKAVDGKIWHVVYDTARKGFSPLTCFGKYRTKKDCEFAITYWTKAWRLPA